MFTAKGSAWVALAATLALAGCATTNGALASSAERLEDSASDLVSESRSGDGYTRDAQAFALQARDFRRTVEDRDSDGDDVQKAFRSLSERYHSLRDEMERAEGDAARDFEDVTQAYLDIEREVGKQDDRYARD